MNPKTKYFWFVTALIGSAGIWLPILVTMISKKEIKWEEIPPNMVTYFLSLIVSGCADKGMKLFENLTTNSNTVLRQSEFLNVLIVAIVGLLLVLFSVMSSVFDHIVLAYILSGVGVFGSLKVYWDANVFEADTNPYDALGGKI